MYHIGLCMFSYVTFIITSTAGQIDNMAVGRELSMEREPEFLAPLDNITSVQGRDVHFTCSVDNIGAHKIAWLKSDSKSILAYQTTMITQNNRISVTYNNHNTWRLYIHNIQPEDTGTYMCQINTNPMKSMSAALKVVVPPNIIDQPGGGGGTIREGGSIELKCAATGVPEPTLVWRRDRGKPITFRADDGTVLQSVESHIGSTLSLKSVQRVDMGGYLCIASNGIPPTQFKRYDVIVQFTPAVRTRVRTTAAPANKDITLQCFIEASPRPMVTWHLNNGHPLKGPRYIVQEESINEYAIRSDLTILTLNKNDFGEYTCKVDNGMGTDDAVIRVHEIRVTTSTSSTTTTTRRSTTTSVTTTSTRMVTTTRRPITQRTTTRRPKPTHHTTTTSPAPTVRPYRLAPTPAWTSHGLINSETNTSMFLILIALLFYFN